jgi:hypothetical protein
MGAALLDGEGRIPGNGTSGDDVAGGGNGLGVNSLLAGGVGLCAARYDEAASTGVQTMTIALEIKFTEHDGDTFDDIDEIDRVYMVLVSAAAIGDGIIDLDGFMKMARSAWRATETAVPAGTVLQ